MAAAAVSMPVRSVWSAARRPAGVALAMGTSVRARPSDRSTACCDHRRVEQAQRAFGEALDRRVGGAAALHGTKGKALRLGALATGQLLSVSGLAEEALRVGVLLKGRPDRLEAALRASEVNVRTTPFTCGCQASVAINIRMSAPRMLRMILSSRRSFIDISGV